MRAALLVLFMCASFAAGAATLMHFSNLFTQDESPVKEVFFPKSRFVDLDGTIEAIEDGAFVMREDGDTALVRIHYDAHTIILARPEKISGDTITGARLLVVPASEVIRVGSAVRIQFRITRKMSSPYAYLVLNFLNNRYTTNHEN